MIAEVHTLYDASLHDVPAMLRKIADNIEADKYGGIGSAVLVMMGKQLTVHGFGKADAGDVSLLLGAAQLKLHKPVADHGT